MAKAKKAQRLDGLAAQIRVCTRRPLHESRTHAVPGEGKYAAKVMLIAEAPGKDEHAKTGWRLELREPVDGKKILENKKRAKVDEKNVERTRREVRRFKTDAGSGKAIPISTALKKKELSGDVPVKIGRAVVPLTSLDRVYWPDEGFTKADLIRYYDEVSEYILPYLKDRPLIMKRYPAGVGGQSFHQHDVNEAPEFVRTVTLKALEDAHEVDYIVGGSRAAHIYMANLGAIERHPWHSRVETLEHPDWFVFDLDPGAGVENETICEVAVAVREVLARVGLKSYPKTSGSRGLHVYVPIKAVYSYEDVAELAEQIATVVARENAAAATVERSLAKRKKGQIYVDHMQNAHGKSVAAPYSVRPKPCAPVSAPLEWKEVERKKVTPRSFDINNLKRRVKSKGDLFKPVLTKRQSLGDAFEAARELLKEVKVKRARV